MQAATSIDYKELYEQSQMQILLLTWLLSFGLFLNSKADTIDNYQIYIGKTLMLTEASFNPLRSTLTFLKLDSSNYSSPRRTEEYKYSSARYYYDGVDEFNLFELVE